MRCLLKVFGVSFVAAGIFGGACSVHAADSVGRGYNNPAYQNRAGMTGSQRMPTMPTLSINTVGNLSPNLPSDGGSNGGNTNPETKCPPEATGVYPDCECPEGKIYNKQTNTCDACEYAGQIVVDGKCVCPDGTHEDADTKSCVKDSECPDGGVKNSDYTVTDCMTDIYACVNNGGLPNGINDLFNEDLRHSIENGMALCSVQVEKCVTEIRRDCKNIYRSAADVWIDFNARRVQPEYYNYVLRKTGLTPNQAENTCLLLDRNTYGPSFAAVANNGSTTAEYNNRVGAFNSQQGNVLIKKNPQGVKVNSGHAGVDGARGHYARWDAATADCYLRVAAYNKDNQIKNSWLFGAAGNDQPAEAWKAAGDTFTCNKDLFGFSLMNDTSTAAVVGIGGGTLVGAGVGALAGHGAREFDCTNDGHRKKLAEQLRKAGQVAILNEYLMIPVLDGTSDISLSQCREIADLYQTYIQIIAAIGECETAAGDAVKVTESISSRINLNCEFNVNIKTLSLKEQKEAYDECFKMSSNVMAAKHCVGRGFTSEKECADYLVKNNLVPNVDSMIKEIENADNSKCSFKPLNLAMASGGSIYCNEKSGCVTPAEMRRQVARLGGVFGNLQILAGEKNNRAKTTLIGAGVGAGAGGIATGITALIEHNNINCRVGDGLAKVGYGKSHSIGSLKDFYVKWNLQLPDTVAPTGLANDCNSWRALCGALTDERSCNAAQINYRGPEDKTITLIRSACKMSGSRCIENYSVAKSYGACE